MKKLFSLTLTFLLIATLLPLGIINISGTEPPSGTAIGTSAELLDLMNDLDKWAGDYYLSEDIDLTGVTGQSPIGTAAVKFTGVFDGNGKAISGISISGATYQGLFGYADGATVKNLTASGTVTASGTAAVYTGGIIGCAVGSGTFEGLTSYVNVKGSANGSQGVGGVFGWVACTSTDALNPDIITITDCHAFGETESGRAVGNLIGVLCVDGVTATASAVGGTITVTDCTSNGSVIYISGSANGQVGGLIGCVYYRAASGFEIAIEDCINNASCSGSPYKDRIGGIIGWINGEGLSASKSEGGSLRISGCVNNGALYGTNRIGGIIGFSDVYARSDVFAIIENTVNLGAINSETTSGGIIGYINGGDYTINKCANYAQITSSGTAIGGILGSTDKTASTVLTKVVINDCAGYANVTGSGDVGGIVGKSINTVEVKRCFNNGAQITEGASGAILSSVTDLTYENNYYIDGTTDTRGVRLTCEEASDGASYDGWDFTGTWRITDGGVPRLRAFDSYGFTEPVYSYYIAFNANGGTGAPEGVSALRGAPVQIPAEVPEREGYTFYYWTEASNDNEATVLPGDYVSYDVQLSATLYAYWERIPVDEEEPEPEPEEPEEEPTYIRTQTGILAFASGVRTSSGILGNNEGARTLTGVAAITDSESARTHAGVGFGGGESTFSGMGALRTLGAAYNTGSGLASIIK